MLEMEQYFSPDAKLRILEIFQGAQNHKSEFLAHGFSNDQIAQLEKMFECLSQKLTSTSRFVHSIGVCQTMYCLSFVYGLDSFECCVAGLLHDWSKEDKLPEELEDDACGYFGINSDDIKKINPLYHSYLAGETLPEHFNEVTPKIAQAIAEHTIGSKHPTKLSQSLYIADMIEPGRKPFETIVKLREQVGVLTLNHLYFKAMQSSLQYLISQERWMLPCAIEIYNEQLKML